MDAGIMATVLLMAGLLLIALELMIPSMGIIGLAATVCLVVSFWSAWQAWWGTSPAFFWTYVTLLVVGIPAVSGGMLVLIQSTSLGNHVVLKAPSKESLTPLKEVRHRLSEMVGEKGAASSLLTPGGMVEISGQRYHAESQGMMVDPGTPIEVIAIKGTRLVVKPWAPEDAANSLVDNEKSETADSSSSDPPNSPLPSLEADSIASTPVQSPIAEEFEAQETEQGDKEPDVSSPSSDQSEPDILDFQIPE